jgi:hypothetical protein
VTRPLLTLALALLLTGLVRGREDAPAPPPTPKKPVTDVYHGVKVVAHQNVPYFQGSVGRWCTFGHPKS